MKGRFNQFGGQYVPETLMNALQELEDEYEKAINDESFMEEYRYYLKEYVGRPSTLDYAENITKDLGGAKIYLKREDLNHTGAHKINNAIGQILLAKRMGKKQSTIANKLRLLKLSDKVRILCLENNLTERHARALLSLPNEELQLKVVKKVIANSLNVKKTEELINTELLKLAGEQMKKRKGKGVLPGKLYVNTIKQVLNKFNIPAEYKLQDKEECIEITVSIPKNK